jgi:hypothetical protein
MGDVGSFIVFENDKVIIWGDATRTRPANGLP